MNTPAYLRYSNKVYFNLITLPFNYMESLFGEDLNIQSVINLL